MKLGAPELLANKLCLWGDHYQLVALRGVQSIISKEILTKRGLVSCLDYYKQAQSVYVKPDRRMPNGTYVGVRGAGCPQPLLDFYVQL